MDFLKKYFIPRIIQFFLVIIIGVTIVFFVPRFIPTDPVESQIIRMTAQGAYLDPAALTDIRENLRNLYGLEGSLINQYYHYWKNLIKGDLGPSFSQFPTPVIDLILISLPWTIGLCGISIFIAWVIGVILGGIAAYFPNKLWVKLLDALAMGIRPIPMYIIGLVIMLLFAFVFSVFPLGGGYTVGRKISFNWSSILDLIYHAFLPVLSLVLFNIGFWFLNTRSVASNIVSEDYVTYAEASGLSETKIVFEYVIRNAILPQVTGLALEVGAIFSGALIIEMVFSYPGLGTVLYTAIISNDYNLIMGITIFSVFAVATTILIVDLLYPLLDPRIRY